MDILCKRCIFYEELRNKISDTDSEILMNCNNDEIDEDEIERVMIKGDDNCSGFKGFHIPDRYDEE